MFFVLSKTLGRLADPYVAGMLLLALAGGLRLLRRAPRLRRRLAIVGVVVLLVFSNGAVATLLLSPLETWHPRPKTPPKAPGAVVMLTGTLDLDRDGESYYELTESSDRFVEALRLAHRHPGAVLILSGGTGALTGGPREADVLGRLARELGFPPGRLRIDRRSRNTRENAVESKRLLKDVKGPVLLVTSALHMPRSVACFRKVGQRVVPWPVDFRKTGVHPGTWLPRPWSMDRSRAAIREYIGLLAYWASGYI